MRRTALSGAIALAACAFMPALAQAQAALPAHQTQPPIESQLGAQIGPQAGAPTPQQAQKAQQSRSDAEAYLQREEAAATGRRTQDTERANRAAGVPDEASRALGNSGAAGSARAGTPATTPSIPDPDAPPPYGPVLHSNQPNQPQAADPARRNPAEIHDETDTGANPAAQPSPPQGQRSRNPQASRRPAWQPANEPMAPRPLREERSVAGNPEPIPAPAAAPQPVVPSSAVLGSCVGGSCTDAAGNRYNGISAVGGSGAGGNAGVSAGGRLCNRSGATVQCF